MLYDGVSPVLRSMATVMNRVIDSFESMQAVSANAVNTGSIQTAREELSRVDTTLDRVEESIREADTAQKRFNNSISSGGSAADGLLRKFQTLAATVGASMGVEKVLGLSDDLAQREARLNLIIDDGGSVQAFEDKIMMSALRARSAYSDTLDTVTRLGLLAGDAFSSNDEILAFTELMNKNFKIAGSSATEQASAMYQLTQALAAGKLQGDEYRSVIENAPMLAKSIEQYMQNAGIKGTMKEWAADGLLTAEVIKGALFSSADEIESRWATMSVTFSDTFTMIKNYALTEFEPVLAKISEITSSERFQTFVTQVIGAISMLASFALWVFDAVGRAANFIEENWSVIEPIFWGVVAAITAYKVITLIAAGAQAVLNAVMNANPITWIILLVVALIGIFVAFTDKVVGAVWWLGALFKNIGLWIANLGIAAWAIIQNVGLWFANLGLGIWEVLKACAENVLTAFKNAWINIQIGFVSFVSVILEGIKQIIDWLNMIPGVNISTDGISSSITDFANQKAELEASKHDYTDIGSAWDKGSNTFEYKSVSEAFNTFEVFEDGWGTEAYAAGAEIGAEIHDNISNTIDGFFDKLKIVGEDKRSGYEQNPFEIDNLWNGIYDNTGLAAENTAKMADSMDFAEEDLKYLRDIAEREAVNRFTTAEIKVEMPVSNTFNSAGDIDGILDQLEEKVYESMVIAAEGVHY